MKRLFTFFAVLGMTCVLLTISASAVTFDYSELPLDDSSFYLYLGDEMMAYCYVVPAGEPRPYYYVDSDGIERIYFSKVDVYWNMGSWELETAGITDYAMAWHLDWYPEVEVSHNLYDLDGNVVCAGIYPDYTDDPELPTAILPSAIPNGALGRVLSEVIQLVVIVIPVVAGLFGIRKGISFLIGRIRGV